MSQPDERCGVLQAQTQVLPSQQVSSVPTINPTTSSASSPPPVEPINGSQVEHAPLEQEETVKPKRKRYTMNAVC